MAEMDPIDSVGKSNKVQKGLDAALAPFSRPDRRPDEAYDIRILADGTWTYHGSPIGRRPLVKLFSKVLRRDENGDYWLITPAERGRIVVDDAPFLAVDVTVVGRGAAKVLTFRTNVDDTVDAGSDHRIRVEFDRETGEPRPYITIRDGLEALIVRSVYYELAELASEQEGRVGVVSNGCFFALDQAI
jgi:hypothetical protein